MTSGRLVSARHLHEKQESIPLILYSCCDINDAMHYSRTVCTFGGGVVVLPHIQSASDVCQYFKQVAKIPEHTPTNTHAQKKPFGYYYYR